MSFAVNMILTFATFAMISMMVFMLRAIVRCIHSVIPTVLYKIDPLVTGVVIGTMFCPFFCMARGHAQIDGCYGVIGGALDDDWLGINKGGAWGISNINAAVEAGLPNVDGQADIGCHC